MGYITFHHKGSFNKIERFMNRALKKNYRNILSRYGEMGVDILRQVTPTNSGTTAESWGYGIEEGDGKVTIYWTNSNENNGVNIAILLIYGHALQNGSYVQGEDFVNPALRPMFQDMANTCWREVVR